VCGIAGIVSHSKNSSHVDRFKSDLYKMTTAIEHRGRDGEGHLADERGGCFLGHRRLSIIDLSEGGRQPMATPDGRYRIVFNGEIYNYKELAEDLEREGVSFSSKSDTEVLLYGYLVWNRDCLNKFRGMFAFAVWDSFEKKLFAARDHLGIKPFYWFLKNDSEDKVFAFASELKAFKNVSFLEKRLNFKALFHYLSFYSLNPPMTFWENVFALMPGHFIEFKDGQLTIERYWDIKKICTEDRYDDQEGVKEQVREKLSEAVGLRMRADVTVGAFLSGGIDSATIVGLMSRMASRPIKTFSIGFGKEGKYINELPIAKVVAQKFGCDHHELKIDGQFLKKNFDGFIKAIDQPSGDGINSYLISKVASDHVKVALSGLGGDEVFLGYRYFQDLIRLANWQNSSYRKRLLPFLACGFKKSRLFRSFAYRNKMEFVRFFGKRDADLYLESRRLFSVEEKLNLVKDRKWLGFDTSEGARKFLNPIFESKMDHLNSFSKAELCWYVPGMLLRDADATSMAFTLEMRFPFLDRGLVELLLGIPSRHKIHLNQKINKPLLANLFKDLLPEEVLRFPKHGFEMPIGFWLLEYFSKELNELENVNWLNGRYVSLLIRDLKKNPKNYLKVWSLLVLHRWLSLNGFEALS